MRPTGTRAPLMTRLPFRSSPSNQSSSSDPGPGGSGPWRPHVGHDGYARALAGQGAGMVTRAGAWPCARRPWGRCGAQKCRAAPTGRGPANSPSPRGDCSPVPILSSSASPVMRDVRTVGTMGWGSGGALGAPCTYTADRESIHSCAWTCFSSESEAAGAAPPPPPASRVSQCVCRGPGACGPGGARGPGGTDVLGWLIS